jgi:RimJ/RimL family protein N-acetyltransferase/N-acetylglutamate synthase-like GNAT family acetyltransferase
VATLTISIERDATAEQVGVLARGLTEHGEARSEPRNHAALAVFARDAGGRIVGGLRGATVWGWLEIELLWVADAYRKEGLGARLLATAEAEARVRGCRHARVDTFDFQAPGFYARLGYEEYALLEDFPRGHRRHFFRRDLEQSGADGDVLAPRPARGDAASGIAIRPYALDDASTVLTAVRESIARMHPWMPWCHPDYSLAESQSWLDEQVPAFAAETAFEFAIVSADGGYLGGCGLNQIDVRNRRANLGYWVRSSAAGRGVATAAARSLHDWAVRHTDLVRLEIVVAVGNLPSRRVAEKLGARREGLLRDRLLLADGYHDALMFSLTIPRTRGEAPIGPPG